jgi:hypothetical protein
MPFDGRTHIFQSCSDENILGKCPLWPFITALTYMEDRQGVFIMKMYNVPLTCI